MELGEESSEFGSALPSTTLRNMSSSSSAAFFSANQSPFFSPRSPATTTCHFSESTRSEATSHPFSPEPSAPANPQQSERISSSAAAGNHRRDRRESGPASLSLSSNRIRSCDVFIGLHGRKPSLLRFVNWLRAELEAQGMSCFVSDRARLRNAHKHGVVERAMDVSSFGVVVLTAKSFGNPYTIEELRLFSGKKNLVPIFFELSSGECLVRDIVERRGDPWEEDGGELWAPYGGDESEWREAVRGLSRVAAAEDDNWKLEARDGNWRDCVSRAVAFLATKLGRRSVVDRLAKWRENAEVEEFPFPRNEGFVGRKRELSELEFMLFGELVSGESERGYFELKARPKRKKDPIPGSVEDNHQFHHHRRRKGKDVWKESEKEIEMNTRASPTRRRRRRSSMTSSSSAAARIQYGKGIACVSGEPGIGKTELLLEFAYRHHQRYKMVLWIGGESRYIRQNYLNLKSFLDVDVGIEGIGTFEDHEEGAVSRVRKELMRNIPFLIVIDNLESDHDWWDRRPVMDLLPRFGGETHILVSTRLHRPLNLEPLRLTFLSAAESMSLMTQSNDDFPISETDALRTIEDRLNRSTIGLAIVGSILSELPITPSRLLETANRMMIPSPKAKSSFLSQLFEVCFSIFDHADGPESLATRMVHASGWFAPSPVPTRLLAGAARRIPRKTRRTTRRVWRALLRSLACGLAPPQDLTEAEASSSMLIRFGLARAGSRPGTIRVSDPVRLYARSRSVPGVAKAVAESAMSREWTENYPDHAWAACFLLFGFGREPAAVEAQVAELVEMVKETVVPLAIKTFLKFSRCSAAAELLRLCTNAMEAAEQAFVTPVEKWLDGGGGCRWRPVRTGAQLNPCLWQELALGRAAVLETRAKLMIRGARFDVADDLIRKTVFIRTSICGEEHSDTAAARETLGKITRLIADVHVRNHNTSL